MGQGCAVPNFLTGKVRTEIRQLCISEGLGENFLFLGYPNPLSSRPLADCYYMESAAPRSSDEIELSSSYCQRHNPGSRLNIEWQAVRTMCAQLHLVRNRFEEIAL